MIGVDIVHIPEVERVVAQTNGACLQRMFAPSELQTQTPEHVAGLWAAKEAIMKAASLEPGSWLHIIISHNAAGRPQAMVGSRRFDVSIAHHVDYAVAIAQECT